MLSFIVHLSNKCKWLTYCYIGKLQQSNDIQMCKIEYKKIVFKVLRHF